MENIDRHGRNKKINYKLSSTFSNGIEEQDFKSLTITDKEIEYAFTLKLFPSQKNENYDEKTVENISWGKLSEMQEAFSSVFDGSGNGYAGYPNNTLFIKREFPKTKDSKWKKFYEYLDILPFATTLEELRFTYYNSLAEKLKFSKEDRQAIDYYIQNYLLIIPKLVGKIFVPFTVGPLREKPKSKYLLKGNKFDTKDYYGILSRIDEYRENYNPFYPGNAVESLEDYINSTLSDFRLGRKIEVVKKNGVGSIYISDKKGTKYNLAEASSGLIQVLPIIVNEYFNIFERYPEFDFEIRGNRLNYIEQPELHLHPKLQTELIEFLTKKLNTYIIETHSEHIVRKIQVLVARGDLKKEMVAVYYFDKDEKTGITSIKEMELDEKGRFITEWPPGFFDTDTKLALEFLREISKN